MPRLSLLLAQRSFEVSSTYLKSLLFRIQAALADKRLQELALVIDITIEELSMEVMLSLSFS